MPIWVAFANISRGAPDKDYTVVNVYPHDRGAFTEGLLFKDGFLYEITGQNGGSSLRKVELKTGKVLQQFPMPQRFFGEGLALLNGKLYQLTWQNHVAFVYDFNTFDPENKFDYPYEGWGLTTDGKSLIASDGSKQIRFFDPLTFKVERTIDVTENDRRIVNLNELEWVQGDVFASVWNPSKTPKPLEASEPSKPPKTLKQARERARRILANVWKTDRILKIDPATGKVLRDYDLSGILPTSDRTPYTDVLNGIAYDPQGDHLYVTGKYWPKLFEIKLKP